MEDFAKWIKELLQAITKAVIDFFIWLVDYFKDFFLWVFDGLLAALVAAINMIPVPEFITNGLQSITDGFPPLLSYLMANTGLSTGFGIIAAAYVFRLLRKFATLFQW